MNDLSTIILKSGINSLLYESEEAFKKSLINSLSFKLNEAIKESKNYFASNILISEKTTEVDSNIKNLLEFVENYDSKTNSRLIFKNGTTINITENEISKIKFIFNSLNSKNRKIMAKEITESIQGLKRTLEFYDRAKKVLQ